jgi:type IV pilus assembly protein PilC
MERDYYLTSKIRGAMTYPIFVLGTIALVMTVMIVFVMPQLIGVLTESGVELPIVTKVLISVIEFIRAWGWLIFVGLFGGIGTFVWWIKTPKGKIFYDETSIKLPVLGNLTKSISLSRFAENLSTLISGGIPIAEALGITADIVGNSVYKNIIMKTRDGVRRGESISSLLNQHPKEIPPVFTQMTTVGEKTGKLDSILANVADFYRKEVDVFINNSLGLIEPVLMVLLGLVVGFFVIAFLLPLYQGMSNL